MYPHGNSTSKSPFGVVSNSSTANTSEKASTAFISPKVWRIIEHDAANASPKASIRHRNTRLPVQKQAMANMIANAIFVTGFSLCRKESPGTYSRNPSI